MTELKGFCVLKTTDTDQWNGVLSEIPARDLYHLPQYSRLAEIRGEGEARLLVLRENGCTLALPLLIGEISLPHAGNRGLKDATSVYGYPGPIASSSQVPSHTRKRFLRALQDYLLSENVVAAFSRLNPVLAYQHEFLEGCGETLEIGQTVSIDLSQTSQNQVAAYRKSTRYEIRRLRSMGAVCEEMGPEFLDEFVRVYQDTMQAVDARDDYYFDTAYFRYLLHEMGDVFHVFACKDGGKCMCAAVFGVCAGIVQYHLAGTVEHYRRLAPMKLLLDTVREWSAGLGAHTLHLGGGVAARNDSLLAFKRGFSDTLHSYRTWQLVVAPQVYDELCREAAKAAGFTPDGSYFPLYRRPALVTPAAGGP